MLNFAKAHYYRDGLRVMCSIIKITPLWDAFCAFCETYYECACVRETRTKVDVKYISEYCL